LSKFRNIEYPVSYVGQECQRYVSAQTSYLIECIVIAGFSRGTVVTVLNEAECVRLLYHEHSTLMSWFRLYMVFERFQLVSSLQPGFWCIELAIFQQRLNQIAFYDLSDSYNINFFSFLVVPTVARVASQLGGSY
jgi:hypothetical protein